MDANIRSDLIQFDAIVFLMGNDSSSKAIEIGTVKVKMFDRIVKTLSNDKHIPNLRKSLISLGDLDILGYEFFVKNDIMNINKGALIAIKEKKVKNLYILIGNTILAKVTKVKSYYGEYFASVK